MYGIRWLYDKRHVDEAQTKIGAHKPHSSILNKIYKTAYQRWKGVKKLKSREGLHCQSHFNFLFPCLTKISTFTFADNAHAQRQHGQTELNPQTQPHPLTTWSFTSTGGPPKNISVSISHEAQTRCPSSPLWDTDSAPIRGPHRHKKSVSILAAPQLASSLWLFKEDCHQYSLMNRFCSHYVECEVRESKRLSSFNHVGCQKWNRLGSLSCMFEVKQSLETNRLYSFFCIIFQRWNWSCFFLAANILRGIDSYNFGLPDETPSKNQHKQDLWAEGEEKSDSSLKRFLALEATIHLHIFYAINFLKAHVPCLLCLTSYSPQASAKFPVSIHTTEAGIWAQVSPHMRITHGHHASKAIETLEQDIEEAKWYYMEN